MLPFRRVEVNRHKSVPTIALQKVGRGWTHPKKVLVIRWIGGERFQLIKELASLLRREVFREEKPYLFKEIGSHVASGV